jgi:hypothetical protein
MYKRARTRVASSVLEATMRTTLTAFDQVPAVVAGDQLSIDREIFDEAEEFSCELRYFPHIDSRLWDI